MKRFSVILGIGILTIMLGGVGCQNKKGPSTASGLNRIHFDFDRASIRPDMIRVMDGNSHYLKSHKNLKVMIEGHCDERGTNEYNIALGDRRAQTAYDYLTAKGISPSRLKTVSYGEEKPLEKGSSEAAWYRNRRAEFVRD